MKTRLPQRAREAAWLALLLATVGTLLGLVRCQHRAQSVDSPRPAVTQLSVDRSESRIESPPLIEGGSSRSTSTSSGNPSRSPTLPSLELRLVDAVTNEPVRWLTLLVDGDRSRQESADWSIDSHLLGRTRPAELEFTVLDDDGEANHTHGVHRVIGSAEPNPPATIPLHIGPTFLLDPTIESGLGTGSRVRVVARIGVETESTLIRVHRTESPTVVGGPSRLTIWPWIPVRFDREAWARYPYPIQDGASPVTEARLELDRPDGHRIVAARIDGLVGSHDLRHLEWSPVGARLTGVLIDERGDPVEGVAVFARSEPETGSIGSAIGEWWEQSEHVTVSGRGGRFEFTELVTDQVARVVAYGPFGFARVEGPIVAGREPLLLREGSGSVRSVEFRVDGLRSFLPSAHFVGFVRMQGAVDLMPAWGAAGASDIEDSRDRSFILNRVPENCEVVHWVAVAPELGTRESATALDGTWQVPTARRPGKEGSSRYAIQSTNPILGNFHIRLLAGGSVQYQTSTTADSIEFRVSNGARFDWVAWSDGCAPEAGSDSDFELEDGRLVARVTLEKGWGVILRPRLRPLPPDQWSEVLEEFGAKPRSEPPDTLDRLYELLMSPRPSIPGPRSANGCEVVSLQHSKDWLVRSLGGDEALLDADLQDWTVSGIDELTRPSIHRQPRGLREFVLHLARHERAGLRRDF